MQIEADTVGHDLAFGWSRFNRGVHTPPGVQRGLDQGEMARSDVSLDPGLPDDAPFGYEGDEVGYDDGAGDPGASPEDAERPGEPRPADEDQAFAGLATDSGQLADAVAPF